jgi:hypothetical protein
VPEVKVEMKDEAAPEVKVEVKDELPSPPRGQSSTSRASKRARTEATPPPPPPEPWRATFSVPPMYRHPSDGESAGYNVDVRMSAAQAGSSSSTTTTTRTTTVVPAPTQSAKRHFSFMFYAIRPPYRFVIINISYMVMK